MSPRVVLGAAGALALSAPPAIELLESRLVTHLLVQIPLFAVCGYAVAPLFGRTLPGPGQGGPHLAVAIPVALFWMLPRSMDAALASGWIDLAKGGALTLAVGVPLGRSWPGLGRVTRGFLIANAVPMLAVLGWLYLSAPTRLCSYYLVTDQADTGRGLLALAALWALWLVARSFAGSGAPALPRSA